MPAFSEKPERGKSLLKKKNTLRRTKIVNRNRIIEPNQERRKRRAITSRKAGKTTQKQKQDGVDNTINKKGPEGQNAYRA